MTAVPGLTPEVAVDRRRAGVGHRRAGEDGEAARPCRGRSAGPAGARRSSSALTWSGLSSGRACSRSAAAPATTGAAIDVPPMRRYSPPTTHCGHSACEGAADGQRRDDVRARGEHVGLADAVLGDAAARERRERVVAGIGRAGLVGGADGDHERVVARRVVDGVGRVAAVARGGDDDDAGVPGELDGRVERVVEVGAGRVRADREVDDADVEVVLVVDDELQRRDDVQHGRVAVRRRRS